MVCIASDAPSIAAIAMSLWIQYNDASRQYLVGCQFVRVNEWTAIAGWLRNACHFSVRGEHPENGVRRRATHQYRARDCCMV